MQRHLGVAFALLTVMTAGCASQEAPPPVAEPAEESEDTLDAGPLPEPSIEAIPISWSGRLETGVRVCELQTPSCHTIRPMPEDQERVVEEESGRVLGGQINFTWVAASPLTQELRAVMVAQRPACDDCEDALLGFAIGPSPLQVPLEAMDRRLEEDERIRIYVRAPHAQFHPPLYVQADVAQEFDVEGHIQIERPA